MDTPTIKKQIDLFIQKATSYMHIDRIVLYGSAATENRIPHDIDLIVIGDFQDKDPDSLLYDVYTDIPRMIDFHVHGLSLKDKSPSYFLQAALREGKTVYSYKSN